MIKLLPNLHHTHCDRRSCRTSASSRSIFASSKTSYRLGRHSHSPYSYETPAASAFLWENQKAPRFCWEWWWFLPNLHPLSKCPQWKWFLRICSKSWNHWFCSIFPNYMFWARLGKDWLKKCTTSPSWARLLCSCFYNFHS